MKKYDLLKILGITFGIVVLLSWVIPAGTFMGGGYIPAESTFPIGLFDLVQIPAITLARFIEYGLLMLAIGGLYGVLNKTGVYSNLVENIVKKCKGKERCCLIWTIVAFALLAALTGIMSLLFVLVPFAIAVLMLLGYNKITAFAATVGALLVGQIGAIYGWGTNGFLNFFFDLGVHQNVIAKIILFAAITALLVIIVVKKAVLGKPKKEEIPLYEENSEKKSTVPLLVISIIAFVLLFVGLYNWFYMFNVEIFNTLHTNITEFVIRDYPIFGNLLGNVTPIGWFGIYDQITILVFVSIIIGWVYSVKFNEIIDGFVSGFKTMLPVAFYAVMASVVLYALTANQNPHFVNNIVATIVGTEFSFPAIVISGGVASLFYNDFGSLLSTYGSVFAFDGEPATITALIIQSMNGLVMLVAPVSVFLLAGLRYMEITFKEWIKYIWKFALLVLAAIVLITLINMIII